MDVSKHIALLLPFPRTVASLRLRATRVSTSTYEAALVGEGTISIGSDVLGRTEGFALIEPGDRTLTR